MELYQYSPLPSDGKHIRLLLLHPRNESRTGEIQVSIMHSPLEAERRTMPTFMALSYVWGSDFKRRDLSVVKLDPGFRFIEQRSKGKDGREERKMSVLAGKGIDKNAPAKRLSVTANLVEALEYLPFPDKHIVLWVDAVCINQEDMDERAAQVKLMAEIYASAAPVYAWLGPPFGDSNLAMTLLRRISDAIEIDWRSTQVRPKHPMLTGDFMSDIYIRGLIDPEFALPWYGPEARAIESLFNRPWFERLWVRQEITLGAERTVLACGHSSIGWDVFRKAAILLHKKMKDYRQPNVESWRLRVSLVADAFLHNHSWLGRLLRQMQRTKCKDPRDRIYGILGIWPGDSKVMLSRIQPDYRKPVIQVYREVLLAEMAEMRRVDLLSECLLSSHSTVDWSHSWVPNWSVSLTWDRVLQQLYADGQSATDAAVAFRGDQEVLRISGVLAATVVDTLKFPSLLVDLNIVAKYDLSALARHEEARQTLRRELPSVPPVVGLIKTIAQKLDLSETARYRPLPERCTVREALCYAFSDGHLSDHISAEMVHDFTPSMGQYKKLVEFALTYDKDAVPTPSWGPDVSNCLTQMYIHCRDRALLITEEGFVVSGPATAQPGDQIAVLLGCMRPMILRPQPPELPPDGGADRKDDSPAYTVVGPCNGHGLDWGETLLGPVPADANFRWSRAGQAGGNVGPVFRDQATGENTVVDPRIDFDLLRTDVEEDAWVWKAELDVNEPTPREAIGLTYYKRPDVEYFKKKGVSLRTFDLV